MKALCSNEEIVKIVSDSNDAEVPNFDLPYTHLFPFEYLPDTVDDAKTFICFDVDVPKVPTSTYYLPALHIWIFTHKSKLRLPEGGVRLDRLAVLIDSELNGNRNYGLGELSLHQVGRFSPITDYQGRSLTYHAVDFNRPSISRKPPVNRRNW